jgi:uncharacterized membrane protein/mono/diheme cytochrome c family protein
MLNFTAFVGRFHPLFVHLPVGILLIAVVFQLMAWRKRSFVYDKALEVSLLVGSCGAVVSCITGYLLSGAADYDTATVWWHQWLGIAIAIISCCWYLVVRRKRSSIVPIAIAILVLPLIGITGHLGGTLTHGEDYLSFSTPEDTTQQPTRKPIENVQEAMVYKDIVQPVLSSSCYSCHGEKKQKGKLRLDIPELMLKGGKNGEVLDAASPQESEMIRRLLLPLSDKKHMPPKDKKQLSADEIALLHWWVESGFSFDRKVKELPQTQKVKPSLIALSGQQNNKLVAAPVMVPTDPVEKAGEEALRALSAKGIVVLPVSAESNYLTVNFVACENATDGDMRLLIPIKKQVLSIKLGNTKVTDSAMGIIADCKNLVRLHLENTAVTDRGLSMLTGLDKLKDLNLTGTMVTGEGVTKLTKIKGLENIYLFRTPVVRSGWEELQRAFPSATLDSGGYSLPILKGDTSFIKPKKVDKK